MEINSSIALQKQVRDNSETLQSEFLDMRNWEQQMKRMDSELQNSSSDQTQSLPPIRRKKTSRSKSKAKDNGSKSKRIKSYDYSAWDTFDVDKACEEIDKEDESEDSGEELLSKEELEKNHEEATKHKIMGNTYVKEQKWGKAMACYTEAIKVFPYDAVFYANRALCHLKMDNLFSAEADCTSAIQRDEFYVKAYHRRATARMALKQYAEAIQDLKTLLSHEPDNKEAKKMLASAQKALDASKPVILSSTWAEEGGERNDKVEETKVPAKIVEKDEKDKVSELREKKVIVSKVEDDVSNKDKTTVKSMEVPKNSEKKDSKAQKYREWLPDVEDDVAEVKLIDKPPHQRARKPLRSIPIVTSDFNKLSIATKPEPQPELKTNSVPKTEPPRKSEIKQQTSVTSSLKVEIPPPPKTAVQFLLTWNRDTSPDFRYEYLKQIPPESLPTIFQDSMESSTFNEILRTLATHFIPHTPVFQYLNHMTELKRFRMLTMFMGRQEKEDLTALFEHCKATGHTDDDINLLRTKYEL